MNRAWRGRTAVWLGFFAVALLVAACDDSPGAESSLTTSPTTTAAPQPVTSAPTTTTLAETTTTPAPNLKPTGGEAVIGLTRDQEPPTLNPFQPGGDKLVVAMIGQAYLTGVYDIDGVTLELVPEVVTELPSVDNGGVVINEDGSMTVQYTIREEARWADGTPISGDDFEFTLQTILDPNLPINKDVYQDIVGYEAGRKSFRFTLVAPTVRYELLFGTILPKHDVEGSDFENDWNDSIWVSGGPFVFESWEKGQAIRLVRNENYWKIDEESGLDLPFLDGLRFQFVEDNESLVARFKGRILDVVRPPNSAIPELHELEAEGIVVEALSGTLWEHLNFQFGPGRFERNPASANENVDYRRAVAHAIDRQRIVDELVGEGAVPLQSFVGQYIPVAPEMTWEKYGYDVALAREYAIAAWTDLGVEQLTTVFTTTSNVDERVRISELLAEMMAEVGIVYENQLEISQLFFDETLRAGTWDLGQWAWNGGPGFSGLLGVLNEFDPAAAPGVGFNYYRWGTEESSVVNEFTERYSEILAALSSSIDPDVVEPLAREAEGILADQVVIIPLYARIDAAAVWADTIGGFKHNPTAATLTWNVEDWYHL
ncbi:MAG: ABC transporter substrate-binding protein [Acidimicrobiia bacterium]|nr:ABC transporter substrate-binding protein [Acidimicrobiia bacterium]